MARADREHARRRRVLVGRDACRRARGAEEPGDLLVRARRQSSLWRHADPGSSRRRPRPEHDGRSAPRADPRARLPRVHAADDPPDRRRRAPADARVARRGRGRRADRLPARDRGRAADADDLHAARPARGRPPLAVRGGRARIRLQGLAQIVRAGLRRASGALAHARLRHGADREEAQPARRRHALDRRRRSPRRRRSAAAHRRRAVRLLLVDLQRRLRDDSQRRRRWADRADGAARSALAPAQRSHALADRDRGDRALDDPVPFEAAHGHARDDAARGRDRCRATRW